MAYWWAKLKVDVNMNNKGYSLVEILLSVALIGLIAISFLPLISFSYSYLIKSEQFTRDMYNDQELVEKKIDALRFQEPVGPNSETITIFGVDIPVHEIKEHTSNSGEIQVFLPKQTSVPPIPVIEAPPEIWVRNASDMSITPRPSWIELLNDPRSFFVNEVNITTDTRNDYLMSVYRWYITDEVSESHTPSAKTQDFLIVHEWNEARMIVPYKTALENNFVPNFKEYVDPETGRTITYNRLNFSALARHGELNTESLINRYGNRYVIYGVTPYSLAGRMGQERLSNAIYIRAPRIVIDSAMVDQENNAVIVEFNLEIEDVISTDLIRLNPLLGDIRSVVRDDENHKRIIIEVQDPIASGHPITDNSMTRGAVVSKEYGAISIWYEDEPNGAFTITMP